MKEFQIGQKRLTAMMRIILRGMLGLGRRVRLVMELSRGINCPLEDEGQFKNNDSSNLWN